MRGFPAESLACQPHLLTRYPPLETGRVSPEALAVRTECDLLLNPYLLEKHIGYDSTQPLVFDPKFLFLIRSIAMADRIVAARGRLWRCQLTTFPRRLRQR